MENLSSIYILFKDIDKVKVTGLPLREIPLCWLQRHVTGPEVLHRRTQLKPEATVCFPKTRERLIDQPNSITSDNAKDVFLTGVMRHRVENRVRSRA
ncbi:hypothetical protein KIN20_009718 [Parelaphostrongylus tenuis]|uniref:Uncharacterized protein n=1 Tax=Parelaphostrongylus tenuis TaxID=148309 RepID=A0AAD5M8K0_PARTN|nr:hypothetical protein KIN20_009718 [Parelaphostrongylus tenuis]